MSNGSKKLSESDLQEFLAGSAEWTVDEGKLHRGYSTSTYLAAAELVQEIARVSEEMNHHPDLLLSWRRVSVWLVTHDSDGITELDTRLALKADALYGANLKKHA